MPGRVPRFHLPRWSRRRTMLCCLPKAATRTTHMNYPYGLHAALVAIDRETGITTVEKFMIAYDIGCAINPMLVEGQLQGGLAQCWRSPV